MALVRVVQRWPGLSRAELAKETGLTKSTVSLLIQDLIDEGWLSESDIQATGAIGRRPTPLFLNAARLAMLGAEVSLDSIHVLTVSLLGEVLFCHSAQLITTRPSDVIRQLTTLLLAQISHAQSNRGITAITAANRFQTL